MPTTVRIGDEELQFPDSMSSDQIRDVLRKRYGSGTPAEPATPEQLSPAPHTEVDAAKQEESLWDTVVNSLNPVNAWNDAARLYQSMPGPRMLSMAADWVMGPEDKKAPDRKSERSEYNIGPIDVGRTATNIPTSFRRAVGGVMKGLSEPFTVAEGAAKLGAGVGETILAPQLKKMGIELDEEFKPYSDAALQMMLNRYGSWEKLRETIETDFVGFADDLSGFLGMAPGAAAKFSQLKRLNAGKNIANGIKALVNAPSAIIKAPKTATGKLGGNWLKKKLELSASGMTKAQTKKYMTLDFGKKPISQFFDEFGITGTPEAKIRKLNQLGDSAKALLTSELKRVQKAPIQSNAAEELIKRMHRRISSSVRKGEFLHPDTQTDLNFLEDLLTRPTNGGPRRFSLNELQEVKEMVPRSNIYPNKPLPGQKLTVRESDSKKYFSELRQLIEDDAPGVPVRKINRVIQRAKTAAKDIMDANIGEEMPRVTLTDRVMAYIGGQVLGGPAGAAAGVAVERLGQTGKFKSGLSRLLNTLNPSQIDELNTSFRLGTLSPSGRQVLNEVMNQVSKDLAKAGLRGMALKETEKRRKKRENAIKTLKGIRKMSPAGI